MIDNLILSENAYFYFKKKDLSKTRINKIFIEVSREKMGHYTENEIQKLKIVDGKRVKYSLCIFKFKSPPTFIDDPEIIHEIKYAYLLIIEYDEFIVISKKHITGLKTLLKDYIEDLDYTLISRLYLSDETYFEKFSMNNMDISDKTIRKKNIEANNIRNNFSPITASKYILRYMRIADKNQRVSLSFSTSKITELGQKVYLEDYLKWTIKVANKIKQYDEKDSYLDHFALPLDFQSNIDELEPNGVLFLVDRLYEEIENGRLYNAYYEFKGKKRTVDIEYYLNKLKKCFEVVLNRDKENRYFIRNKIDKNLQLKINKASITIHSKRLRNLKLQFLNKNDDIDIVKYLNKIKDYIITFDKTDIVYCSKKLFKDTKLLSTIDSFLKVFKPFSELERISSEKGEVNEFSTTFEEDSLFYFIDNTLADEFDYLVCDDMGNEWADFISIENNKRITFIHAKSGDERLSASDFHDIVGQAQKNLGNLFDVSELERKIKNWKNPFKKSKIERLRCGDSLESLHDMYETTLLAPNVRHRVYLVVDFISKSNLEEALQKLKEGKTAKHQVVQLLWLLSSLVLSCQEMGVEIFIACLP